MYFFIINIDSFISYKKLVYVLKIDLCFYRFVYKIYFARCYFKGRKFRDFANFWQNSRKFVPAKYLVSINRESLFSRKKNKSSRLVKVKKSKNLNRVLACGSK